MPYRAGRISRPIRVLWLWVIGAALLKLPATVMIGCGSPEDGRPRGGGPGGDGGNYHKKPVHVPSKLDGTKELPNPLELH
jgi:hypothetical protein